MSRKYPTLEERMQYYEHKGTSVLDPKRPAIVRISMKGYKTFMKYLERPFDRFVVEAMENVAVRMCNDIQNCVFGYVARGDIVLLLRDDLRPNTEMWCGGRAQKMISSAASMATLYFSASFFNAVMLAEDSDVISSERFGQLQKMFDRAVFDARAFTIAPDEVANYFVWRQQRMILDSTMDCGEVLFGKREVIGHKLQEVRDRLREAGRPWEELPVWLQRGAGVVRVAEKRERFDKKRQKVVEFSTKRWDIDHEIPLLQVDREYIANHIGWEVTAA